MNKIFKLILIILHFSSMNSFKNIKNIKDNNIQKPIIFKEMINKPNNNNNNNNNNINYFVVKKNGFLKIIRSNCIAPTLLLSFTGGWIMNPSFMNLLHSPNFITSTIITNLIMSASMILNDIYDINIDKINNPNRPLITGEVSKKEAYLYIFLLLSSTQYLSLNYLPSNLQTLIYFIIFEINIYTPFLKKILFVKNISCALLVSFSLFFTGLASSNELLMVNKNFNLLIVAMNFIFFGSLSNEILLDIKDHEGDKENNINTLSTYFSKDFAWKFVNYVIYFNVAINSFYLGYLFNKNISMLFIFIMLPQLIYLNIIKKNIYSSKSINEYMKYTNITLFIVLLYFCTVSLRI